jgi:hypothetical protein
MADLLGVRADALKSKQGHQNGKALIQCGRVRRGVGGIGCGDHASPNIRQG